MLYHVNKSTGEAGKCKAEKGKCPFGGADEHFTSPEAARSFYESNQHSFGPPLTETWTQDELRKVMTKMPGVRGLTLEAVRKNLKNSYEDSLAMGELDNAKLIKSYGDIHASAREDNFSVIYEHDRKGNTEAIIYYYDYGYLGEQPLSNVKNLVLAEDNYDDDSVEYSYRVKLDPKDAQVVQAMERVKSLAKSYEYLNNPLYPKWMVLPQYHRHGSDYFHSMSYGKLRQLKQKREALERKIERAQKASPTVDRYAQKLKALREEEKAAKGIDELVKQKPLPKRLLQAINAEQQAIQDDIKKTERLKRSAETKASSSNIESIQSKLDALADEEADLMVELRKDMEEHVRVKLAKHHPARDGRKATAQAKAWIKSHPELLDYEIQQQLSNL